MEDLALVCATCAYLENEHCLLGRLGLVRKLVADDCHSSGKAREAHLTLNHAHYQSAKLLRLERVNCDFLKITRLDGLLGGVKHDFGNLVLLFLVGDVRALQLDVVVHIEG